MGEEPTRRQFIAIAAFAPFAGMGACGAPATFDEKEEHMFETDLEIDPENPGEQGGEKSESRAVQEVFMGVPTSDGAGVRLTRVIGSARLDYIDPFLLLDEFKSDDPDDYIAGFPSHPHRGIETVTYMIDGRVEHADSLGHSGVIGPGDVQWMTAGSGIIHSEMPAIQNGKMWGFQLWVNLPAAKKLTDPRYQEIESSRIPTVSGPGCEVRVIAGQYREVRGPITGIDAAPVYLDVSLASGAEFDHLIPAGHNAFVFVLEGIGRFGANDRRAQRSEIAIFGRGGRVEAAAVDGPVRFLLVAGEPLNEPVARGGPFVMNTREEIEQAFREYANGTFIKKRSAVEGNP